MLAPMPGGVARRLCLAPSLRTLGSLRSRSATPAGMPAAVPLRQRALYDPARRHTAPVAAIQPLRLPRNCSAAAAEGPAPWTVQLSLRRLRRGLSQRYQGRRRGCRAPAPVAAAGAAREGANRRSTVELFGPSGWAARPTRSLRGSVVGNDGSIGGEARRVLGSSSSVSQSPQHTILFAGQAHSADPMARNRPQAPAVNASRCRRQAFPWYECRARAPTCDPR